MLRRLYVARDDDPAGAGALKTLTERAVPAGIEVMPLEPRLGDFNDDLATFGRERLIARLRDQLRTEDAERFLLRRYGLGCGARPRSLVIVTITGLYDPPRARNPE